MDEFGNQIVFVILCRGKENVWCSGGFHDEDKAKSAMMFMQMQYPDARYSIQEVSVL